MRKSPQLKNATNITNLRNGVTHQTEHQTLREPLQSLIPTEDPRVFTSINGEIVYIAYEGAEPEVLSASDDECGMADVWATGAADTFRAACSWHDKAYINKDFFNERGWTRKKIDQYFLSLMLDYAGDNLLLRIKARLYYYITRLVGGIYYNRR